MAVDAEARRRHRAANLRHGGGDVAGQGAAVRIAHDQCLGTGLLCRQEDAQGEVGVPPVAIEEVLSVEEHALVVRSQESDRVLDHPDRLVQVRLERLCDMAVP